MGKMRWSAFACFFCKLCLVYGCREFDPEFEIIKGALERTCLFLLPAVLGLWLQRTWDKRRLHCTDFEIKEALLDHTHFRERTTCSMSEVVTTKQCLELFCK